MREILKPASALLIITLVAAVCLGYVHAITLQPIEAQKVITEKNAVQQIFGDLDNTQPVDFTASDSDTVSKALACSSGGSVVGYAVFAAPKGYSGSIELMVGFDTDGVIKGLQILSQSETPGLGANCVNPAFLDQFPNKSGVLAVTKSSPKDNEIQAMTSSTITTTAVVKGVNEAAAFFEQYLKGR
ncbi:MAG: RnfABCDGE type electron transport complex subunit G [Peptococcaceae bacterium]|jgi:electron transport complex protein RnfG|nr:RnfABCDGE type electron transport complex subunit G [Peptococcaceae bacterium]